MPSTSCATRKSSVESTPPEKQTRADSWAAIRSRSVWCFSDRVIETNYSARLAKLPFVATGCTLAHGKGYFGPAFLGGDSRCSDSGIALSDLPAAATDILCTYAARCGEMPDVDSCKAAGGTDMGQLLADVKAGKTKYDGKAAAACLTQCAR